MKNLILTLLALSLSSMLLAQLSADEYLKKSTAIPLKVCQLAGDQQDAFVASVKDLTDVIKEDIQQRDQEANEYIEAHGAEMEAQIMKNSGLSDKDIKKAQSGKELTEAETNAMANKKIQKNSNLSLDEASDLSNLNKEGQEAWAKGYSDEQMAMAQANTGKNTVSDSADKSLYKLLSQQSALSNKVTSQENKLRQQYMAIDRDAQADKAILEKDLKPLYDELSTINTGEGSTQADEDHAKRVIGEIKARQDLFCEKFTPRMLEFLELCKLSTATAIPDYDKIEEIQFQMMGSPTGTEPSMSGKGLDSIKAVEQYLEYLSEAFKYKLYRTE